MRFTLFEKTTTTEIDLPCRRLYAVGYSGREQSIVREHILELERELGVPAPPHIPMIYPCGAYLLTRAACHCVPGGKSSGEVEPVLLLHDGEIYVGVGSDHTDRVCEVDDILCAKQLCPKPVSAGVWRYDEVRDHWDDIRVRSYQTVDGEERLYQDGTLRSILPPESILAVLRERGYDLSDCAIFCGTIPLTGSYCFGAEFRAEMIDDALGRRLSLCYAIEPARRDE